MAQIIVSESLKEEIFSNFKEDSSNVFRLMKSLENNPYRGKALGTVGGIIIKELKYGKFRFYFITDGHVLKFETEDELSNLLIKFVRMSEKKDQQKIINNIKSILKSLGFESM